MENLLKKASIVINLKNPTRRTVAIFVNNLSTLCLYLNFSEGTFSYTIDREACDYIEESASQEMSKEKIEDLINSIV